MIWRNPEVGPRELVIQMCSISENISDFSVFILVHSHRPHNHVLVNDEPNAQLSSQKIISPSDVVAILVCVCTLCDVHMTKLHDIFLRMCPHS